MFFMCQMPFLRRMSSIRFLAACRVGPRIERIRRPRKRSMPLTNETSDMFRCHPLLSRRLCKMRSRDLAGVGAQ